MNEVFSLTDWGIVRILPGEIQVEVDHGDGRQTRLFALSSVHVDVHDLFPGQVVRVAWDGKADYAVVAWALPIIASHFIY